MKRNILQLVLLSLLSANMHAQTIKNCASCATSLIKSEQLKGLSLDEIRLLTNEIYARKGYEFENPRFQQYFESESWYKSKKDNSNVSFNEIEKKNIELFKQETSKLKSQRAEIIKQLKTFKEFVLADKRSELKLVFNFEYEQESDERDLLKEVFSKINLDDVHYYKSKGLNNTTVDNGFVQIQYEVNIGNEQINLSYNYRSHSEIMADFDVFTDYHSESEFAYNWQFEFKNNTLRFIRLVVAG